MSGSDLSRHSHVNRALILIDAQVGPFTLGPAMYRGETLLKVLNQVAAMARSHGIPVIWVQHDGPEGSPMVPFTPNWELHPDLEVLESDHRVRKTASDAFHDSSLQALLTELGVTEVYIGGYATELCVDTTVRRAASLGYKTTLVADAHSTKDRPFLDAAHIIPHEHWVLSNVVCPGNSITVRESQEIEQEWK